MTCPWNFPVQVTKKIKNFDDAFYVYIKILLALLVARYSFSRFFIGKITPTDSAAVVAVWHPHEFCWLNWQKR